MKILIYDHGLCTELGVSLAKAGHKVAYFSPWDEAFPKSSKAVLGKGLEGIERIEGDSWEPAAERSDLVCFFDSFNGDKVEHLLKLGKPVWGAGRAERLEHDRIYMRQLQKQLSIPTAPYVPIIGINKLIAHLKTVKDKWIKLSRFRGDIETFHHEDYDSSQASFLGQMLIDFGGNADNLEFVVEDPVEGVEVGYDGFVVDGQYPSVCLVGYEAKDEGYIGKVFTNDNLPKALSLVNEKLSTSLSTAKTFISTEVRIDKHNKGYLIDPCIRAPHPPLAAELAVFNNIPSIIVRAAKEHHLVTPNPIAKYVVAVIVGSEWCEQHWTEVKIDPSVRDSVKLQRAYRDNDGRYWALPGSATVATCVAVGATIEQAKKKVKDVVEKISCRGMSYNMSALDELENNVIPEGKKRGVDF